MDTKKQQEQINGLVTALAPGLANITATSGPATPET